MQTKLVARTRVSSTFWLQKTNMVPVKMQTWRFKTGVHKPMGVITEVMPIISLQSRVMVKIKVGLRLLHKYRESFANPV